MSGVGLEALKGVLRGEEEGSYESEVVAAAAAAAGLRVVRLKPSYARAHHFPFYVPAPAKGETPNGYAVAASKVLKTGLQSNLLRNFLDQMSQDNALPPQVL